MAKVNFKDKQSEFVNYIRDPFNNPRPSDVKQQRIETYRELLFNNVESFLSSNFPVLRTLLDDEQWEELAQDFFSSHVCTTPYFSEIAEEFLDFLQNERQSSNDFPFLLELAHYEWVEMALTIAQHDITRNTQEFIAELYQQNISLSALAWPLVYQFPVQQISSSFLPATAPKEPTYLLVYRDIDDEVNFIQISPLTFRLLLIVQENESISCASCLDQIVSETAHPEPEKMIVAGLETLQDLARKNIIHLA